MKYLQTRPNCVGCTKCQRQCPVHAISIVNNMASIDENLCVHCGNCVTVCPQGSILYISDFNKVNNWLESGQKIVLSLSSAYYAAWASFKGVQMITALRKAGFYAIHETSEAVNAIIEEVAQFASTSVMDTIITTSCPAINRLIQIYYPDLIPCMAPVTTPMTAHGRYLKEKYGNDVKVVHVGPCYAHKGECEDPKQAGIVDAVLTFRELHRFINNQNLHVTEMEDGRPDNYDTGISMLYVTAGGTGQALRANKEFPDRQYTLAHRSGIKSVMRVLDEVRMGYYHHSVVEIQSCSGGCVNGSARPRGSSGTKNALMLEKAFIAKGFHTADAIEFLKIAPVGQTYEDLSVKLPQPSEAEIKDALFILGRTSKLKELDCGGCGYRSCRENAIAVCQGRAAKDSCIQHLHEQASSLSNLVMATVPTLIMVLDNELRIREFSASCERLFRIKREDALGKEILDFMDDTDFERVNEMHYDIHDKVVELVQQNRIVKMNVIYLEGRKSQLVMMEDITEQQKHKAELYEEKKRIAETAQSVIDKQMMIAQTIAGLLGESTAETKVALNKMTRTMLNEGGE